MRIARSRYNPDMPGVTMPTVIRLAATLLSSSLVLACLPNPKQGPAGTAPESPTPSTLVSSTPRPVTPTALPTSTAVPDRYPAELVGRLLVFPAADGHRTIFRVGRPGTFTVPRGSRLLGVIGDQVVTAMPGATGSIIKVWSFETGAQIGNETVLAEFSNPYPMVAGSDIVISSEIDATGHDLGIVAYSTIDGSVRTLIGPTTVRDLGSPQRGVVISESGAVLATTVCATGIDFVANCRPTLLVHIESASEVRTIDLDGQVPRILTDGWILVGDIGGDRMLDNSGRERWSTRSMGSGATVWSRRVEPDGRLFAEIRSLSGEIEPRLIAVDPQTGEQTRLYRPGGNADWTWYPDLSTDRLLAIGPFQEQPCMFTGACGADDDRTVEASALDVVTGELTPNAISITFPP